MWLFTNIGFFSIVQKPGTDFLTVRARVKHDLESLSERYLPGLSPIQSKGGTDYPWRATTSHADFAAAMGRIALDIDYGNFKNEIAARQGTARAGRYGRVWEALYDMPEDARAHAKSGLPWGDTLPPGKKVAYGGVLFDPPGKVLLREPKNHFDGYVWTFAKGRPDPGEKPEQTALREVFEETGVNARILAPLPGEFAGGSTINRYFLMAAETGSGGVSPDDKETASIRWVTPEQAHELIGLTSNSVGRSRDRAVLVAAVAERRRLS